VLEKAGIMAVKQLRLYPRLRFCCRYASSYLRSAILALVAGISCGHLVDPPLPATAELFVPPSVYARWWTMVEECSGLRGSLENIQWYSAPEQLWNPANSSDPVEGYWSRASNRIVLNANDTLDGGTVRHEMLHALVRSGGHPRWAFLQACGGVVACAPQCVRDAGAPPPPDPTTPTVSPSALEVTVTVSPESPSSLIDGGLATFTISVRNPLPHPVVALLPTKIGGGIASSYRYSFREISGAGVASGDLVFDIGVTYFAAGETKRDVIDFAVVSIASPSIGAIPGLGSDGIALPPGTYSFRGDYGGHFASYLNVVLSP
jgi:hypothetical protein